jgi:hypothetical protein
MYMYISMEEISTNICISTLYKCYVVLSPHFPRIHFIISVFTFSWKNPKKPKRGRVL